MQEVIRLLAADRPVITATHLPGDLERLAACVVVLGPAVAGLAAGSGVELARSAWLSRGAASAAITGAAAPVWTLR